MMVKQNNKLIIANPKNSQKWKDVAKLLDMLSGNLSPGVQAITNINKR
jgi:hypothetical protein